MAAALSWALSGIALAQAPNRLTIVRGGIDGPWTIQAWDINEAGQVVFSYRPPIAIDSVAFWDGAAFTYLGPGSAYAINNAGQMAGIGSDIPWPPQPTVWDSTGVSTLATRSVNGGFAYDINDRGQVVGVQQSPVNQATLWQDSRSVELGPGWAYAINNAGQVVGMSSPSPTDVAHAVLWDGNGTTFLDSSARYSLAYDINDSGQIVGQSGSQATLWQGGRAVELGALGHSSSLASAINNAGQIVGFFVSGNDPNMPHRAALWNGAIGTDLNSLLRPESVEAGWILGTALGINDSGWIVGEAYNRFDCADGACGSYGFVLSISDLPDQVLTLTNGVPEPSTYALMLAGLAALCLSVQRRRRASASK
jgi:probable HAF family extracellular repeat protein